ncbi:hypothetical protein EDB81DRAFT_843033 [Dactylonectria macrodidyma]|uniref:Uncharacterized protein n=1 Tax=Dactylonectria macrodidyma TaxID=307937 RepID=A0A9P9EP94_9HYPO|nr:hypothetical protein EDB81DRAFT_843033 [Dactylonectria macrodidyma]
MATSWNNVGLHGVDPNSIRNSDYIAYDEAPSSHQSFARWPSPQPTTSTTPFVPPMLSPPPPSHRGSNTPSPLYIAPAGSRPAINSPHNPTSPHHNNPNSCYNPNSPRGHLSPNSPHDLNSPRSPRSPGYQTLQRGQFPSSSSSDPFASPRATTYTTFTGTTNTTGFTNTTGTTSPRARISHGNLDALLEHPYFDCPPETAGSRGNTAFRAPEDSEGPVRDGWRPWWLRHQVIGGFLGTFVLLAVVGEVVMWMISRDDWENGAEGLWTFGPVVVTSVLAMLWARVECQTLLYMPWIILEGRPASGEDTRRKQAYRTVLLDYPGMNSLRALAKSFSNRHHLVAASVAVSLLLRAQIVLSTCIFHAEVQADGSRLLRVRSGMMHAIAGVFCLLGGFLLPMLYHAPPKRGITARDPTSAAGTAALLASSQHFLARLSGTGGAGMNVVTARLAGSWYTTEVRQPGKKPGETFQLRQLSGGPPVSMGDESSGRSEEAMGEYRPWTLGARVQTVSIVACAVLLTGVCVIFALRGDGDGMDASDDMFIVWTFVPTFIFAALAIFWSRIDIDTRRCGFKESLALTYMNEFGLYTVFKSLKYKDWGVFVRKSTTMLGWLMPIFTAGLFAITEVGQRANLQLRQETQFQSTSKSLSSSLDADVIDRILLRSTPSYPAWTYEDLAFPELELVSHGKEWPLPNTELMATVPSIRAVLTCETLSLSNGAGADLKCAALGSSGSKKSAICPAGQNNTGLVVTSCTGLSTDYALNYIWGSCGDSGDMSIMRCNESITELDVYTTFHTEDLTIDTDSIPLKNTSSMHESDVKADVSTAYAAMEVIGTDDDTLTGLDGFFRTLVLSRLDMRLERLLAPERQNSVSAMIRLQHGIVGAQALSSNLVRKTTSSSKLRLRANDDDEDEDSSLLAASVDYFVPRLTQSRTQTFVLLALLSMALILGFFGLRTTHRGAPLPKDPSSIAAQASLLADSTMWYRLPEGASWMDDEDLARRFRRKTFRLGWHNTGRITSAGTSGRNYGIGIVQDEGKAARMAERAAERSGELDTMRSSSVAPGRYISMAPGLYSYGDIPLYEKE